MTHAKRQHHEAIRARAERALAALYHNATVNYPRLDDADARRFDEWFDRERDSAIDYIGHGGAYDGNYPQTLAHPCNAGRYHSLAAQQYYIRKGMREQAEERSRCAMYEYISEFGELSTWGRGGRTLAPDHLINQRGDSGFNIRADAAAEHNIAYTVRLIRIVESFNAYVAAWCYGVADLWHEHEAEDLAEAERLNIIRGEQ